MKTNGNKNPNMKGSEPEKRQESPEENGGKKKKNRQKKTRNTPSPVVLELASTSTANPNTKPQPDRVKILRPPPPETTESSDAQSVEKVPRAVQHQLNKFLHKETQKVVLKKKNSIERQENSPARGNGQQNYNSNQNNRQRNAQGPSSSYNNKKFDQKSKKYQENGGEYWSERNDLNHQAGLNQLDKEALAIKNQRSAYYFSENAGQAPSVEDYSNTIQHELSSFPLKHDEPILICKKYDLMISSTSQKCNAFYIRIKSQGLHDVTLPSSAIIQRTSSDEEVRNACLECISNFDATKAASGKKNERSPKSQASREYLRKCFIKELDEPPEAFPDAIYYCLRCDFHITSVSHAKTHLETSTHFDDVQRQAQRSELFQSIPEPTKPHLRALKSLLLSEREEYIETLTLDEDTTSAIILFLKTTLFASLGYSHVDLQIYGSYTYEANLLDSDLNVAFSIPSVESSQLFQLLGKIVEELRREKIDAELVTELPNSAVVFEYMNISVRLCWLSHTVCLPQICVSKLLKTYVSLRTEIPQFIQLVRLWATKLGLDSKNKQKIGLPRYGFDLMVIHFLQQSEMIPVLHELSADEDGDESVDPNASFQSEDGSAKNAVPEEARERRIRTFSKYLTDIDKIKERFNCKKDWVWGSLWIEFFKYYSKKHRDGVVQITQKKAMSKDATRWNRKSLHVVDPFRGDNVLSIPKVSSWLPYFFNCLLTTYLCFAIPTINSGPIASVVLHQNKVSSPTKKSRRGVANEPAKKDVKKVQPVTVEKSIFDVKTNQESDWNEAQEEMMEDQEVEDYSNRISSELEFDGIRLSQLKPEDVEIDEHHNGIYSRRTVMRVHRKYGYEKELEEKVVKHLKYFSLTKFKAPKKKTKKAKREAETTENIEPEQVKPIESTQEDENDLEVAHVNFVMCNSVKPVERTDTPPTSEMWNYWASVADSPILEFSPHKVASTTGQKNQNSNNVKTSEKLNEVVNVKVANEKMAEKLKNEPSTSKPVCEYGEFPGSGTFSGTNVDYVQAIDEHICYEEFFIKGTFDSVELKKQSEQLCSEDYCYTFDSKLMSGGYEMETRCSSCDGHHSIDKCPTMEVPPIEIIHKKLSEEDMQELDDVITTYYEKHAIATERLELLEKEVQSLQTYLRDKYKSTVVLTIFGSVMTGIGVNGSDIDICLRFDNSDEPPANMNAVEVIVAVAELLRRAKMAKRVQAITTAKVPIVKFQLKLGHDTVVDADISYYNILALYNTKLLKQYTTWTPDQQFAKLGLFVKHWAKHCDIGDASKGSISSYAHILLLISYLQQCDPPVLPRLQESFRDENSAKRLIENWDTYFYEPIGNGEVQRKWAKNKQSCAELLIGFFDFYSRFKYKNFVVQCRREAQLAKMEKEWNKPLCIEDPFDLHHNLGSGVTKKMFAFIHRTFICSRRVFMTGEVRKKLDSHGHNFNDLYRKALLNSCSQGHAPTDRQCHICQRIGHFAEGCPKRSASKSDNAKRQRFMSSSANTSNRGRGDKDRYKKVEPTHLEYFKRPYRRQ